MRRLFPDNTFVEPKIGKGLRLILGEAPGSNEAETGEPFVGQAGGWLKSILPAAGINIADVTISNCISCRPLDNIFPTDPDAKRYISPIEATQAVTQCQKNYVEPLLKGRPWTRIDLLGDKALQLVAKKDGGIYKWRGSPLKIPALGDQYIAIATLHPAAIARDQSLLPAVINDFRKSATPPPEFYNLFPSVEDVRKFAATEFAFDIETTNWKLGKPEITMVGLSAKANNAIVVPFKGAYVTELQRIFRGATDLIGQNCVQFDLPLLQESGVSTRDDVRVWDTMLLQHLRFPDLPHDLEFIGSQFSSKPAWKQDKGVFELYNARDVDVTFQAYETLKPLIEQYGLKELYELVQVPLARICKLMHARGFRVDPTRIEEVRAKLKLEMAAEEVHLPEHLRSRTTYVNRRSPAPAGTLSAKTGKPVKYITIPQEEIERPWASSTVIAAYLYDELKLPVQINPKSEEITTGKVALEKLYRISKNRSVEAIRRLRKKASIINLFAKEEMIASGIQHPHFNVHGTASGRLSSSDPNLQNIPESARFLYVPHTKGWAIIDVDYSQIENRLTAYLAGDKPRLQRFIDDPSFSEHKYLASQFLGIPYAEVEKSSDPESVYIKAKKIVHGTNYGEGAKKIAMMNDLDMKEVKLIQDKWKGTIAETTRWQTRTAAEANKLGYLTNPFGRKRWFYTSSRYTESLSFLPQSTAADMIFRAMLALMYERINWPLEKVKQIVQYVEPLPAEANLLLQVHDSLIIECPYESVDKVVGVLKRVMEQPFQELNGFWCPIGIAVGPSWGEAEKYVSKT